MKGRGTSGSHLWDREMQGRHKNELGDLPCESILAGLHISLRKNHGISLQMATYSYYAGWMSGARILPTHVFFRLQSISF